METCQTNREIVNTLGNLVETLFDEISTLPLSDGAKTALVTIMLGDLLRRDGRTVYFTCPPGLHRGEAAA